MLVTPLRVTSHRAMLLAKLSTFMTSCHGTPRDAAGRPDTKKPAITLVYLSFRVSTIPAETHHWCPRGDSKSTTRRGFAGQTVQFRCNILSFVFGVWLPHRGTEPARLTSVARRLSPPRLSRSRHRARCSVSRPRSSSCSHAMTIDVRHVSPASRRLRRPGTRQA